MLSLRRRLILVHLAATIVTVSAAAFIGWWELSRNVNGQLDAALLALAETEIGMLKDLDKTSIHVHEAPAGSAPPSLTRLDRLVQIIDGQGQVLARSNNLGTGQLPVTTQLLAQLAAGETVFDTLPEASDEPLRVVSVPTLISGQRYGVQVAGSLDDVNRILYSATILFALMALALLTAIGWIGIRLSRKAFVAIEKIVEQARSIGDANLHHRLPHPGGDDEFGHLVDTLNAMLVRIEKAFESQRRFTADASHELRSPLSRLRTEIEVTLRRPRNQDDYVVTLHSCLEEVGRLTMLVEELLLLARLDSGQERGVIGPLSLNQLAQDAINKWGPSAQDKNVALLLEADAEVFVNAAAAPMALVLRNLVENALKFSPPGSCITLRITALEQGAEIAIVDQGPGIPEEELPFIFERFFRASNARASDIDGVGLGLALSQALAQHYGGHIHVRNSPNSGCQFTLTLPFPPR
ncbi:HAMP domain-containing protein [Pseudoduganella sp. FT93W]|uniref:histidine kinase n=1 Tax=Duganella fentianensis TaxID=2692177 RepID=A0A845I2Z8_9BURK|nr:ATP-binding protein [Duganella fentianensis]MYN47683.1 HAMP domain-containing protein [Duganella fentianensis]